ncbi:MAG: TetR/AcrR family transcriptional regulator C-terminal domain-containing protein [Myxococcaceae bacterium]
MMSRPRRQPLSPDRLAQAALTFIDRHGLEELSTRRLGKTLGVEGMALYKHFASRDALLDAVAELMVCELTIPPKGPGWAERVRAFARGYRALARVHPKAYPLLATRRLGTERSLEVLNGLFAALLEEGFVAAEAALLFRTIANFCQGTALDELAIMAHLAQHPGPRSLPLAHVDAYLHPAQFDSHFETGLALLLDGFIRRKAQKKKEKR